jgi:hypothetical protein
MFRTPMSLDDKNRKLTLIVCAIALVSLTAVVVSGARLGVLTIGILGVVLGFSWAMSPRALVVDTGELRVERRAWSPLRIPLSQVASASPLADVGAGTLRVFGVGGFFGSYGVFSNGQLGRFRLYATHGGQSVLVRRRDDELPIVLTPDDVAGAIAAIDGRPQLGAYRAPMADYFDA